VPKHVYFRSELPKTNVGKILRRALRDELRAAAGAARPSPRGNRFLTWLASTRRCASRPI